MESANLLATEGRIAWEKQAVEAMDKVKIAFRQQKVSTTMKEKKAVKHRATPKQGTSKVSKAAAVTHFNTELGFGLAATVMNVKQGADQWTNGTLENTTSRFIVLAMK